MKIVDDLFLYVHVITRAHLGEGKIWVEGTSKTRQATSLEETDITTEKKKQTDKSIKTDGK